jgi:hypothetical protein
MKYVAPYGVSDPNASYVNGDPTIALQGSIPPAAVFENPQREVIEVITDSGFTPSDADLTQLMQSIRSQFLNYAEDTGSVDHLSVAYHPPLPAYNKGLPLHVRVRNTNTGGCDIDAGAGRVPIRKMNGADVAPGDLPAGCMADLVFDGTVFQLINFGGAGGGTGTGDVFTIKIPYTVDSSVTPGIITANFTPPLTTLVAGDMLAVKVANTTPGPTTMNINALPPVQLAPNGSGIVLQGDIHQNDVVVFFYDGTHLYFAPNPEIDAPITYTIGPSQQFPDVPTAVNAIRRKTIGANGYVTLKMITGVFAPFTVSHPSGDRLLIQGTMIGANPVRTDFAQTGADAAHRAQDAAYNIAMLRTKYGTEIKMPYSTTTTTYGVVNNGPGNVTFQDILISGTQVPSPYPFPLQSGTDIPPGYSGLFINVSVWGSQIGFYNQQSSQYNNCWATANTFAGFDSGGFGLMNCFNCGSYGNTLDGYIGGNVSGVNNMATSNARFGFASVGGGASLQVNIVAYGNGGGVDVYAANLGVIFLQSAAALGVTSPPETVIGNNGALIMPQ